MAPGFPNAQSRTMRQSGTKPTRNSPFMLGVSGHRDLDPADLPGLREAVAEFVRQLRDFLPNTDIHLTVGMAAGADLLVAQTAIDLGLHVEAVLPMPLQQYAADFEGESLASLRSLLEHPDVRCVELSSEPRPFDQGASTTAERDEMYAKLTQTLIRRTSLLLALWDGRTSRLAGGTADTVLRYLGVRTDEVDASSDIEFQIASEEPGIGTRLVYWTPTARSRMTDKETSAIAPGIEAPCYLSGLGDAGLQAHLQMPAILQEQLSELNDYNLDYVRLHATGTLQDPDSIMAKLPFRDSVPDLPALRDIDEQYGKADALAVYYHRLSDRLINLFGVVAIVMSFAYLIYERIAQSRLLLIAYVVTLFGGLGAYYWLQCRHWFGKHLTYRALAETLRARFYLRLADADYRVDAAEVLALSGIELFEGFSWIGFVLKGIEPADIHPAAWQDKDSDETHWVEHVWIESQHQYFTAEVVAGRQQSARQASQDHHICLDPAGARSADRLCHSARRDKTFVWCDTEEPADFFRGPAGDLAGRLGVAPEQDGDPRAAVAVPQPTQAPFPCPGTAAARDLGAPPQGGASRPRKGIPDGMLYVGHAPLPSRAGATSSGGRPVAVRPNVPRAGLLP